MTIYFSLLFLSFCYLLYSAAKVQHFSDRAKDWVLIFEKYTQIARKVWAQLSHFAQLESLIVQNRLPFRGIVLTLHAVSWHL